MPYKIITTYVTRYVTFARIIPPITGEVIFDGGWEESPIRLRVWEEPSQKVPGILECSEMKRRNAEGQKGKGKWAGSSDPLLKGLEEVNRLLTDAYYDDGKPREVSKLSVSFAEGACQVVISDKDQRESAFTQSETVRGALEELEAALKAGRNVWRPWPKWMK